MTKHELVKLRKEIGFSMQDISDHLRLKKSTYQRYEEGSASIPIHVERGVLDLHKSVKEFMESLPARVDARIDKEFPYGFTSEIIVDN